MRKFLNEFTGFDLFSLCVFVMLGVFMWGMFAASSRADFICEVHSEIRRCGYATDGNGNEYHPAEVVEVDGKEVTVKIGRDLYAFHGKGYSVGQSIICEITADDKIIDVLR